MPPSRVKRVWQWKVAACGNRATGSRKGRGVKHKGKVKRIRMGREKLSVARAEGASAGGRGLRG